MTYPIYPRVDVFVDSRRIEISTFVRKLHSDNKYYLIAVVEHYILKGQNQALALIEAFEYFNINIYNTITKLPVDPNITEIDGLPCFILDTNQEPEEFRKL